MVGRSDSPIPNLLDDPIFRIEMRSGEVLDHSLPGILALLLTEPDPIRSFPGLAAEQHSHWYRFLVRCASRALREASGSRPDGRAIRKALEDAAGSKEAWNLHGEDLRRPAFLQLPLPENAEAQTPGEAKYKERGASILTALIGSKNFERKSDAVRSLQPDELVYCLLEFQGGVIYGGPRKYETQLTSSRSGRGSGVPFMGLRLPEGLGATFQRDVQLFLESEDHVRTDFGLDGSVWALWTEPWDLETPLPSRELDPAFIPLARAIRLAPPAGHGRYGTVWFRTSKSPRVEDASGGGLFGDPFTPTIPHPKHEGARKVRGVMEGGFSYPEVTELLGFGERGWRPSMTVRAFFTEADSDLRPGIRVLLEGVAFEQGKTLGFYRRVVPLPTGGRAADVFSEPDPFREAHGFMLNAVREAKKILRASARIILAGDPSPRRGDEAVANLPADRLDTFAEKGDAYLLHLFEAGRRQRMGDPSWENEWLDWICERACEAFDDTLPHLVAPSSQRIRREADALNHLEARLWKLRGGSVRMEDSTSGEEDAA